MGKKKMMIQKIIFIFQYQILFNQFYCGFPFHYSKIHFISSSNVNRRNKSFRIPFTKINAAKQQSNLKNTHINNKGFQQHLIWNDEGVTSLSIDKYRNNVCHVGTKRGKLMTIQWENNMSLIYNPNIHKFNHYSIKYHPPNNANTKPYPIYSMAFYSHSKGHLGLACGGGDRYISIWETESNHLNKWNQISQLGPHTGWVKDLVMEISTKSHNCMHSIGCNCIETWIYPYQRNSKYKSNSWNHMMKRTVESCPLTGSTLSSDLLCLCLYQHDNHYLYAGGVDGRIHQWLDDQLQSTLSFSAHEGRINVIRIIDHLLISAGHDGHIKCWDINNISNEYVQQEMAFFYIKDERILTMECLYQSSNHLQMIVGTASGMIYTISIDKNNDGSIYMSLDSTKSIQITNEDSSKETNSHSNNSIHSIKVLPSNHTCDKHEVLIAHANGLTFITNA